MKICNLCGEEGNDESFILHYYWCYCQKCQNKLTRCSECKEILISHAGRGHNYFHSHVVNGPYPNPEPHHCSLVDMAFTRDGVPILRSDIERRALVELVHGPKLESGICKPTPIQKQQEDL